MAFSSFRLMLGSAAPAAYSDTFTNISAAAGTDGTATFSSQDLNICPGSSATTAYATTFVSPTVSVWIATANNSYVSFGSRLDLSTPAGTPFAPNIAQINANNALVVYRSTASTIAAQSITNTAGTLSASVGETTVVTSVGTLNVPIVCCLDSSNALVLGYTSGTSANNRMSLINPTTLASIQSNTTVSNLLPNTTSIALISISATRAVYFYLTSAFSIQLGTVDVVSGTSFTANNPVSSGVTSVTGMYGFAKIDSSTVLIAYYKSSNTLGVRTVTIGAAGSVTFNTEYTTTITGLASAPQQISISPYNSTDFVITYGKQFATPGNATGDGYESIGVRVAGTLVTFSSAGASVIYSGAKFLNDFRPGQLMRAVQLTTSSVMACLPTFVTSFGCIPYLTKINTNQTTQSWSGFTGSANSGAQTVAQTTSGIRGYCWLGFNRLLTNTTVNIKLTSFAGGVAGKALITDTGIASVDLFGLLAYDTTNGRERILTTFNNTTNTITTYVASMVSNGSGYTANTSTTFTASGVTSSATSLVAIDDNSAIFFYVFTGNASINARRIDTSGLTISSTNSDNTVISIPGDTVTTGTRFLQYALIDSSRIAILFGSNTTGSATFNLYVCIISISGGTITAGTAVSVYTGYNNNTQPFGITVFPNSSTGIITYNNDAAPGTSLLARGFTYSGTTVTLGTQNTLATSQNITTPYSASSYSNRPLVSVSDNEAIYMYADSGASQYGIRKITYNSINSLSTGSQINWGATTTSAALFATDQPNQMISVTRQVAAATQQTTLYYRG